MATTQPTIPELLYPAPRWYDQVLSFFLLDFFKQPWHAAEQALVTEKKYHPPEMMRMGSPMGGNVPVVIGPSRILYVQTRHGRCPVEVRRHKFERIRCGERVDVRYQRSRCYAHDQRLRGKLIS